ncbi:MAG: hypothetical protein P8105_09940 [Dehalococcoidia bacterium]
MIVSSSNCEGVVLHRPGRLAGRRGHQRRAGEMVLVYVVQIVSVLLRHQPIAPTQNNNVGAYL